METLLNHSNEDLIMWLAFYYLDNLERISSIREQHQNLAHDKVYSLNFCTLSCDLVHALEKSELLRIQPVMPRFFRSLHTRTAT